MKKSDANVLKPLFENARGFVLLEWFAPDADSSCDEPVERAWYFIPLVNQVSWAIATMQLWEDDDWDNVRIARMAGNIALRSAPRPHVAGACIFECLGLSSVPRVFEQTDLARSCKITPYILAESSRLLLSFRPAEVEVGGPGKPVLFWPGSQRAQAIVAQHTAKKKKKQDAGIASCQRLLLKNT
jgi:hypothetical protein